MIRKAKIDDVEKIYSLIAFWAKRNKVLERSLNYIYEHIRDFWLYEERKKIVGCCALSIVGWDFLAEIKSLVVDEKYHRKKIGTKLVKKCLMEAKSLGVKNVFALTFIPNFFIKLGFKIIDRNKLPHKIWGDCINCTHFPNCNEEAVIFKLEGRKNYVNSRI